MDTTLASEHRAQLNAHVRALVEYTSIARAREIARETKLVGGRDATKLEPAALKKLLPDAVSLGRAVASSLVDPGGRRAALHTIHRLGEEAFRSQKVPDNIGEIYRRARAAAERSDWECAESRLQQLHVQALESDDLELADTARLVLFCAVTKAGGQFSLPRLQALLGVTTAQSQTATETEYATNPQRPCGNSTTVNVADESTERQGTAPPASSDNSPPALRLPSLTWRALATSTSSPLESVFTSLQIVIQELHDASKQLNRAKRELAVATTAISQCPPLQEGEPIEVTKTILTRLTNLAGAVVSSTEQASHALDAVGLSQKRVQDAQAVIGQSSPIETSSELELQISEVESTLQWIRERVTNHPTCEAWETPIPATMTALVSSARNLFTESKAFEEQPPVALGIDETQVPDKPGLHFSNAKHVPELADRFFRTFLATAVFEYWDGCFLPLSETPLPTHPVLTPSGASPALALNALARNLLCYWAVVAADRRLPTSRLFAVIPDAGAIRNATGDEHAQALWSFCITGLALDAASGRDRGDYRGRRRRQGLLSSTTVAATTDLSVDVAHVLADAPAMPRACAALIHAGFGHCLGVILSRLAQKHAVVAREFATAFATALASIGWTQDAEQLLLSSLRELGEEPTHAEDAIGYVSDAIKISSRKLLPSAPGWLRNRVSRLLVERLAERLRQSGDNERGEARVNVSLQVDEVVLAPGKSTLQVPILVTNTGNCAAAGIEIVVRKPTGGHGPVRSDSFSEVHLAWLPRSTIGESKAVVAVDVEFDGVDPTEHKTLELNVVHSHLGTAAEDATSENVKIRLAHTVPEVKFRELAGATGEPVDLNDEQVLALSASTIRTAFLSLKLKLAEGAPVRAVVYGRRRRGKSSISRSLELNPAVRAKWLVVRDVLNAAPLRSLEEALGRLASLLGQALRRSDLTVTDPIFRTGDSPAAHAKILHDWLADCDRALPATVSVLLLLDEFQRWLSSLDRHGKLTLLSVLRDLNDRPLPKLPISFVLSGLQNISHLIGISLDFLNAVDRYEVRPFNHDETLTYLQKRLDPPLDERTRTRLYRMSGGNPYLLNRFGLLLQRALADEGRSWATVLDVESLFNADDTRVDDYVQYMLHDDEEDSSATLRELSVLRAVSSVLDQTRDYVGSVNEAEVVDWLSRAGVEMDLGVPLEHLLQLAAVGAVETKDRLAFSLPGEWLCRRLATLSTPLLPVTRGAGRDLVLRRYEKLQQLGAGGQSTVWLAKNVQEGGNDVVLKIYHGAKELIGRAHREADALSKVRHEGVVKCQGASIDERHGAVVILEHVDGVPLEDLVIAPELHPDILLGGPDGRLVQQVEFFERLAGAVAECHRCRVVHKDISPRNILVALKFGVVCPILIDFGLAGLDGATEGRSDSTSVLATLGYVAPEKFRGDSRTRASDVWSLGAVIAFTLSGVSPNNETSGGARLAQLSDKVPQQLRDLLEDMLRDLSAERPTAVEVEARLSAVFDEKADSWLRSMEVGEEAFCAGRYEDSAAELLRAALLARRNDRSSREYSNLLSTLLSVMEEVDYRDDWANKWAENVWQVVVGGLAQGLLVDHTAMVTALRASLKGGVAGTSQGTWQALIEVCQDNCRSEGVAPIAGYLGEVGRDVPLALSLDTYSLLVDCMQIGTVARGAVEAYCVKRALVSYERETCLGDTIAWLRRARYVQGNQPSQDYVALQLRVQKQLGQTTNVPAEPLECVEYRGAIVGNEQGHTNAARMEMFAARVHARHPFVAGLKRINQRRGVRGITRPTILGLNSARGLRAADADDADQLVCLLDDSFVNGAGGPLLVAILLHPDSTMKHREAAYRLLIGDIDLFDNRATDD